jgi:putative FmdB family regulatory protein
MPLYSFTCDVCGQKEDDLRPVHRRNEPIYCHCGNRMERQLTVPSAVAIVTAGGNLIHSVTTSSTWKGNRRPKTIGRGHGLGGRRPPPTMAKTMAEKIARAK